MRNLLVAAAVTIVFAVFFTVFLLVPLIVIFLAYWVMVWQANHRSRKAKQAAETADPGPVT